MNVIKLGGSLLDDKVRRAMALRSIVNGEPIVLDGKLTGALPGRVVRPGAGFAQE